MRINKIILDNFGSYEGRSIFDTYSPDSDKNIVIIGGKNGAGKTTLFTAIRLCIYGYHCFGYQSINAFYNKAIIKLMNNTCKLSKPAKTNIEVFLDINNGQEFDNYIIRREWILDKKNTLSEEVSIYKNSHLLNSDEILDFEKYIMHMIPPELFDLYFFDGEKIADFFLNNGNNSRIKNAFLTLCGYDTFDIMSKNFRRVGAVNSKDTTIIDNYIACKDALANAETVLDGLKQELSISILGHETIDSQISELDLKYQKCGGVSQKEWNDKIAKIKIEENKREAKNAWLKKVANDMLPFLILKSNIEELKNQISLEEQFEKQHYFQEILKSNEAINALVSAFETSGTKISKELTTDAIKLMLNEFSFSDGIEPILMLSNDEKISVLHTINNILDFDELSIKSALNSIKSSIKRTQKIRQEIDSCNIDFVNEYVKEKNALLEEKNSLISQRFFLEEKITIAKNNLMLAVDCFEKSKKSYEEELKKGSIKDLSTKAIVFLDKLQDRLFKIQIEKVESAFRKEINALMRKTNFIDDISIDKNFNISLYRNEEYDNKQIAQFKMNYSKEQLSQLLGDKAAYVISSLKLKDKNSYIISVEIDKNTMSSGEKQIFIMALYKSLMELCRYEVPFVIDTPFARIDTEHRQKITQYFFKKLKGQVFILSTNEEINNEHLKILEPNILATYTLENNDNKQTMVKNGCYFQEVK